MDDDLNVQFVLKDDLKEYRSLFIKHYSLSTYSKDYIFNQSGLSTTCLYYLVEGNVGVYTINNDGYERFIGIHKQNTIFNLDSFVSDSLAVITTRALTDIKAIPLTLDDIVDLSKQHSSFYKDFLIYTGNVLRLMCYDASEQSINDVETRLIHFLLLYSKNNNSNIIKLSQYQIATAINASRVQVTRIFSQLKDRNLIEIKRNQIIIKNINQLEEYLNYI
ncbi:MAG: Crp/Fnr family transcriptional regulator [Erysipelotrichaceae bacterium]|nr:Crp/Fnr family transcriptional regulator [Erysipelotrichaceae bacterium]